MGKIWSFLLRATVGNYFFPTSGDIALCKVMPAEPGTHGSRRFTVWRKNAAILQSLDVTFGAVDMVEHTNFDLLRVERKELLMKAVDGYLRGWKRLAVERLHSLLESLFQGFHVLGTFVMLRMTLLYLRILKLGIVEEKTLVPQRG